MSTTIEIRTRILVTCAAVAAAYVQTFTGEVPRPAADAVYYIHNAENLLARDVFGRGRGAHVPDMSVTPLYPALVALVAKIDPALRGFIACMSETNGGARCDLSGMTSLLAVQAALGAAIYVCVFQAMRIATGRLVAAWLGLAVVILSGAFATFFETVLTEALVFPLVAGALLFWMRVWSVPTARSGDLIGLGACLGLAALTRPSYAYLLYGSVALLLLLAYVRRGGSLREALRYGLVPLAVYGLVLAPWLARNYAQFGEVALTDGYGGTVLARRLAYNMMSWPEYFVSFVYWLPEVGRTLASELFPAELYRRLGWDASDTFYRVGGQEFYHDTLREAGGREAHFGYLVRTYLLGDIVKHVLVTIPIAMRGMWAGGYFSALGLLCLVPGVVHLYRTGRLGGGLLLAFPSLFMLAFHAFVSINSVRYNVPLVVVYAVLIGVAGDGAMQWASRRWRRAAAWPARGPLD